MRLANFFLFSRYLITSHGCCAAPAAHSARSFRLVCAIDPTGSISMRVLFLCTLLSLGRAGLLRRFFRDIDTNDDGTLAAPELLRYFVEHGAAHLPGAHANLGEVEGLDVTGRQGAGLQHALRRVLTLLDRTHGDGDGVVRVRDVVALAGEHMARHVADGHGAWSGATAPPASAPQQVWLALTGEPSEMRVTWVTTDAVPNPKVHWAHCGTDAVDPVLSTATAVANSSTYSVPARWWEPDAWKGWIHTAVMTNLTPGDRYNYTVTSGAADRHVASRSFVFSALRVPATAGDATAAGTQIACFGDMGTVMPLGSAVARQLIASHRGARGPFDAVFHFGDISCVLRRAACWQW